MGIHQVELNTNYTIIHVVGELVDSSNIAEIQDKVNELTLDPEMNIIIELSQVDNISLEVCNFFESLHNHMYDKGTSIVFAEPHENVLKKLKQEQLHLVLNITPTIIEATDIINMDILERDILKED